MFYTIVAASIGQIQSNLELQIRFGLRSVSWEKRAEGGEKSPTDGARAKRPAAEPQTEAAALAHNGCPLVTSARFAGWSGHGREGDMADRQPVERSRTARWSRRSPITIGLPFNNFEMASPLFWQDSVHKPQKGLASDLA